MSTEACSFSQIRGTAKKIVGCTSRRFSLTVSIDSAKFSFTPDAAIVQVERRARIAAAEQEAAFRKREAELAQRERELAQRQRALSEEIHAELASASQLQGGERWDEAIAAAERARALAQGFLDDTATTATYTVTLPAALPGAQQDELGEDNETFTVNLSNESNAAISDPSGLGTITDDDAAFLAVNDVTVTEADTNAVFTVTLSIESALTVTVQYSTANGSATAGSDYLAQSGVLTFSPGVTSRPPFRSEA